MLRITTTHRDQATRTFKLEGKLLGPCPGISIQVTSMDDQSVQDCLDSPQCPFAPIPAP